MRRFAAFLSALALAGAAFGAEQTAAASWSFDKDDGSDLIRGFQKLDAGVSGRALRFDGQTTVVVRAAARAPRLDGAFTVEAWVALQTLPWTCQVPPPTN